MVHCRFEKKSCDWKAAHAMLHLKPDKASFPVVPHVFLCN